MPSLLSGVTMGFLLKAVERGMPLAPPDRYQPIAGVDDLVAIIDGMLKGVDIDHAASLLTWMHMATSITAERREVGMDRLTAEMLSHHGIDPLVLHVFGATVQQLDAAGGSTLLYVPGRRTSSDYAMRFPIAPGVVWDAQGAIVTELPMTVVQTLRGRRLPQILSHPVLDPLDLRIVGVTRQDDGSIRMKLDVRHKHAKLADLVGLGPNGCRTMNIEDIVFRRSWTDQPPASRSGNTWPGRCPHHDDPKGTP